MADSCECGNEPSGSIKCAEFFYLAEDLLASQEGLWSAELCRTKTRGPQFMENSNRGERCTACPDAKHRSEE